MSGQKRVRRQHVVSRFYLKGFGAEDRWLERLPLATARPHRISIDDATVIKDFYSFETSEGELSDYFEREFAKIEAPASAALAAATSGERWPLDAREKAALATWIALQHLRSEAIRSGQTHIKAQMIRLIVGASGKEALRRHIERAEGGPVGDERLAAEWADLTQPSGTRLVGDVRAHLQTVVALLPPTAAMLGSKQWSLNVYERKTLLTSDHPVVLLPAPDQPAWLGTGLATAGGYMIPLARRHGLVIGASPDLPDLRVPGTAQLARIMNGGVIAGARKCLYYHPDDAEVVARFSLPRVRDVEMEISNMSGLIREEGLFAGSDADAAARSLPVLPGSEDDDAGLSLADLEWPIPGRAFSWPRSRPPPLAAPRTGQV